MPQMTDRYAPRPDLDARPDMLWGLPDPDTQPDFYSGVAVKRLLAWVVDFVLVAILTAIIVPFTAFTALFFLPLLYLMLDFIYRWSTISGRSSTWGMRLMGIELRTRSGHRLDSGLAFLHTLGFLLTAATMLPQLLSAGMMLVLPRGQGLTDVVLGTTAINRAADDR